MDAQFTAIIQKLTAERGKEVLFSAAKCKALLADYTKGEYNRESRFFLQAVESGAAKNINEIDDLENCKKAQIRLLQEEFGLMETVAADVVDLLALVLRGDISAQKTADEDEWEPATVGTAPSVEPATAQDRFAVKNKQEGKTAKFCTNCGTQVNEGAKFCANCGTAVSGTAARQPEQTERPQAAQKTAKPEAPPKLRQASQAVSPGMVLIQGGTFTMGSPASVPKRDANEGPQHQVTVSSFYMGKYEVTQKEYRELMGKNPSEFKGDNLPVESVSWYEAVKYCNQRSQKEGLTPAYTINGDTVTWNRSANGYRLPTEAEWEYACRAGTTTPYYTGGSPDNAGWYRNNSGGPQPVGGKQANAWGLYDMHGNVWEWCWDWYDGYPSGSQTDPAGAASGSYRVRRGGSWDEYGQYLRSAYRDYGAPTYWSSYLGFRLVRPVCKE